MTGQWFSPGTPVSSANKSDHHDIVLLKVALNTITLTPNPSAIEAGDEFDIHPSM